MNTCLMQRACLLSGLVLLLATCRPIPAPPSDVLIDQETLKEWAPDDLFQTALPRQSDVIDLTNGDTAQIEIRAFQHQFFRDTSRLKPTWVVGYVRADTKPGKESLPGPVLRATYGQPANVRYINRLAETMRDNPLYPYLKLKTGDTSSVRCRWYPIIYNVGDTNHVDMVARMLYPQILKNGIPICQGLDPSDTLLEMSTYYATTVHLHGANVSWHNDGYVNSANFVTELPYGRNPISFGLFGPSPDEQQHFVAYTYPNTFPEGRFDQRGLPDDSLGQHGALLHSCWSTTHPMPCIRMMP